MSYVHPGFTRDVKIHPGARADLNAGPATSLKMDLTRKHVPCEQRNRW